MRGRKKKQVLEHSDLQDYLSFQEMVKKNAEAIGRENLTPKESKFIDEFIVNDSDSEFSRAVKMYKFKHYILRKPLTQEECTYFVDIDEKGTKASEKKRLSKMRVCTLEMSALKKLKRTFGNKFNIYGLKDVVVSGECRVMPAKQASTKEV